MSLQTFLESIGSCSDEELYDVCRKQILHGNPHVFSGDEDKYYEFRKRIAKKFDLPFHEVFIVGSAKLGYSPHKNTEFSLNSDIDVCIVSAILYDRFMAKIALYQHKLRKSRATITQAEYEMYCSFLEYSVIGWIRPDKIPYSFKLGKLKKDWFEFFNSISHGKSEVGNYTVNAGIFKSYEHLEKYIVTGLKDIKIKQKTRI